MNSSKKRKLLGGLMLLSMLLLLSFVLYWLSGQYIEEEQTLKKELTDQFKKSQNEVLDSLLVTYFINPVLKDSIELSLDYEAKVSDGMTDNKIEIKTLDVFDHKLTDEKKIIALKIQDDSCLEEEIIDTMHFIKGNNEDILTRSIRLIVAGSKKMKGHDSIGRMQFPVPLDPSLLKKVFSDDLKKKGLLFELDWIVSDVNDPEEVKMSGIFLDTEFPGDLPAVNIGRYRSHLLALMLPQFLFALLLVGLSGFAFYFTYKSLKKQILLNALKNDFVSNITHELKTPVSTIMVASEALKNYDQKENPKVVDEYLTMMKDEAVRLDGLISKVMDHSKLESKKGIITKERTNLNSLVEKTIEKVKLQSEKNNIKIDFDPNNEILWADIDSIYILGVIYNLLDNSIKYTGEESDLNGGKDIHIIVKTGADKRNVFLSVSDNGPGIPEEYLPQLFDTFFRIPKGDKHNVKGYGLGLSYAKLVMTEHGGTIHVENIPEGGCLFTLKFPKT